MPLSDHADAGGLADGGDADLSVIGAVLADRSRCKILLALADGRALPAGMLASEAGVSAATASSHLHKLCAAGLLEVARSGRYRYYRLAGDEVGQLIETVARLSPTQPIRSLREGTRAHAIRLARRCYNHIGGRLGVAITAALINQDCRIGHDGGRLPGPDRSTYRLTGAGRHILGGLGVALPTDSQVHCCVDWTERRPHITGRLGHALLDTLTAAAWIHTADHSRALITTEAGKRGLREHLGLSWPPPAVSADRSGRSRPQR